MSMCDTPTHSSDEKRKQDGYQKSTNVEDKNGEIIEPLLSASSDEPVPQENKDLGAGVGSAPGTNQHVVSAIVANNSRLYFSEQSAISSTGNGSLTEDFHKKTCTCTSSSTCNDGTRTEVFDTEKRPIIRPLEMVEDTGLETAANLSFDFFSSAASKNWNDEEKEASDGTETSKAWNQNKNKSQEKPLDPYMSVFKERAYEAWIQKIDRKFWPPWRQKIHYLVFQTRWFQYFIYFFILLNCAIVCTTNVESVARHKDVIEGIEDTITFVFLAEMVLKIIGLGIFVPYPLGYWRSKWNVLDAFIVVGGIYAFFCRRILVDSSAHTQVSGAFALRALRPLRTITGSSSLRTVLDCIGYAFKRLLHVFALSLIFVVVMSLVGLELFKGRISNRCFTLFTSQSSPQYYGSFSTGSTGPLSHNINFSSYDTLYLTPGELDNIPACAGSSLPWNFFNLPEVRKDPDQFALLANVSAVRNNKYEEGDRTFYGPAVSASSKSLLFGSPAELPSDAQGIICPYNSICLRYKSPQWGFTNFEDLLSTVSTLYSVTTLEGWSFVAFYLMDAEGWYVSWYFFILTICGSVFILNLALVIVTDAFSRSKALAQMREEARKKHHNISSSVVVPYNEREEQPLDTAGTAVCRTIGTNENPSTQTQTVANSKSESEKRPDKLNLEEGLLPAPGPDPMPTTHTKNENGPAASGEDTYASGGEDSFLGYFLVESKEEGLHENLEGPSSKRTYISTRRVTHAVKDCCLFYRASAMFRGIKFLEQLVARYITSRLWFNYLTVGIIVINAVVLACTHNQMSDTMARVISTTTTMCSYYFIMEVTLKLVGIPWVRFFRDPLNTFDLVVTMGALAELVWDIGIQLSIFRAIRLFRLLTSFQNIRRTIKELVTALRATFSLMFLFFVLIFIFALVGIQLFGGKYCGMDTVSPIRVNTSVCDSVPRANFDNIAYAFPSVFVIIAGDGWRGMMRQGQSAVGSVSVYYFCMCLLVGGYLVLNLFIAVLLSSRGEGSNPEEKETRQDEEERVPTDDILLAPASTTVLTDESNFDVEMKTVPQFEENSSTRKGATGDTTEQVLPIKENNHACSDGEKTVEEATSEAAHDQIEEYEDVGESFALDQLSELQFLKHFEGLRKRNQKERKLFFRVVSTIARSALFNGFVTLVIIFSMVMITLRRPTNHPDHPIERTNEYSDIICVVTFLLEAIIKILDLGVYNRKKDLRSSLSSSEKGYFQHPWNCFDFFVLILMLPTLFLLPWKLTNPSVKHAIRWFRLSRAIRPWSLVGRYPSLSLVFGSLVHSLPALRDATLILTIIWLIYAILGVQLFCGSFCACTNNFWGDISFPAQATYSSTALPPVTTTAPEISASGQDPYANPFMNVPTEDAHGIFAMKAMFFGERGSQQFARSDLSNTLNDSSVSGTYVEPILNRTACIRANYSWFALYSNFDNIGNAMLTLFQVATVSNWDWVMYIATNAVDYEHAPEPWASPFAPLYFMSFMVVVTFFMVNYFVAVLIESYFNTKSQVEENIRHTMIMLQKAGCTKDVLDDNQKDFFDMYQRALHFIRPPLIAGYPPTSWRNTLRRFVRSRYFEYGLFALAVIHVLIEVCEFVDGHSVPKLRAEVQFWVDVVINTAFLVASIMKCIVYGVLNFLEQNRNKTDMITNILTITGCVLQSIYGFDNLAGSILVLFRLVRLYRAFFVSTGMMLLVTALRNSVQNFLGVFFILFLFLFFYTAVGMELFGRVRFTSHSRDGLHLYANFDRFDIAMFTLFRAACTDDWPPVMRACANNYKCDMDLGDCGINVVSQIFFVTLIVFGYWIGMNFFTAVLLESFSNMDRTYRYAIQFEDVHRFSRLWKKHSRIGLDATFTLEMMNQYIEGNKDKKELEKGEDMSQHKRRVRFLQDTSVRKNKNEEDSEGSDAQLVRLSTTSFVLKEDGSVTQLSEKVEKPIVDEHTSIDNSKMELEKNADSSSWIGVNLEPVTQIDADAALEMKRQQAQQRMLAEERRKLIDLIGAQYMPVSQLSKFIVELGTPIGPYFYSVICESMGNVDTATTPPEQNESTTAGFRDNLKHRLHRTASVAGTLSAAEMMQTNLFEDHAMVDDPDMDDIADVDGNTKEMKAPISCETKVARDPPRLWAIVPESSDDSGTYIDRPSAATVMRYMQGLNIPSSGGVVSKADVFDALIRRHYGVDLPPTTEKTLYDIIQERFRFKQLQRAMQGNALRRILPMTFENPSNVVKMVNELQVDRCPIKAFLRTFPSSKRFDSQLNEPVNEQQNPDKR